MIKSQKNQDMIIYQGYIYEKKRTYVNSQEWRCIDRSCKGRGITPLDYEINKYFVVKAEHQHPQNNSNVLKRKIYFYMQKRLVETKESPRKIVHAILRGVDRETIESIWDFELIYRNLRNFRAKIMNPRPFLYEGIGLSEILSKTYTQKRFYFYGPDNYSNISRFDNILMFSTEEMLDSLAINTIWSIDGTFSIVPRPFYQLYTISYIRDHHIFPSVFFILKNKKEKHIII